MSPSCAARASAIGMPRRRIGRVAFPFCGSVIRAPRPLPEGYPNEPRTPGEHLRRRRLNLGLSQREVAERLGVDGWTILNWERGKTLPGAVHLGRITAFLGYFPLAEGATFAERILAARQRLGLTQAGLATVLGVGEEAVRNWERGRRRPRGDRRRRVEQWIATIRSPGAST